MILEISILIFCVFACMFFAGIETAMLSVGPLSIVQGNKKKIYWLYNHKDRIVMTCLIGNNITIVGATIVIDNLFHSSKEIGATLLALSVEIIVLFLFAEVLPKIVAQRLKFKILEIFYYPIHFFYYTFIPFSKVFYSLTNFISSFLSIAEKLKREDIFEFLSTQMHTQDITKGLMRLQTTNAREIMTPLNEIYSLSASGSIAEIVSLLHQTSFSRYPVYKERGDQIIGYVHVAELLRANKNDKISNFIHPAKYVPEFLSIDQLLSHMQKNKIPITFVVSELGSVIGLITLEDIAEELVGDIYSQEQPGLEMIKEHQKNKNIFTLSGVLDIDDFNDFFNLNIKKVGFETLNGLLMKKSKSIPQKDEEIHFSFGSFKIIEGDKKSIRTLRFKRKNKVI